jgi:hypothetical protein
MFSEERNYSAWFPKRILFEMPVNMVPQTFDSFLQILQISEKI